MSLVKEGKVGIIVCKDMSRLGRDYLQVGMFTDIVFPDNDVRFIAIKDNVDSENKSQTHDFTAILNLFNEFHARDTAKKLRLSPYSPHDPPHRIWPLRYQKYATGF